MADLYKALVTVSWRPRGGAKQRVEAGTVVEFDDADFEEPDTRPTGALRSLADVIARGMFAPFDPQQAADLDSWSRDEMLVFLAKHLDEDDVPAHNADIDEVRPIVEKVLDGLKAEQVAD